MRCLKSGLDCEGYADPRQKVVKAIVTTGLRPIVPNLKSDTVRLLHEMLPGTGFKDEREWRYFRHFCDDMAEALTGPLKTALWMQYIPQAGEMKPFIRNAMVALGALNLSKMDSEVSSPERNDMAMVNTHEAYATTKYVKALEGMRKAISKDPDDPRQALMACLLVFCFESFQGHQASASIHASGGLELVSRLRDIPRTRWQTPGEESGGSHLSSAMDDDLYTAYAGLDIQALLFIDTRSPTAHAKLKDRMTIEVEQMPVSFNDVHEAAAFWRLILRRNCHFIATARADLVALRAAKSADEEDSETRLQPGNNPWSNTRSAAQDIPFHLAREHIQCLTDIDKFGHAASMIFHHHSNKKSGDGYYIAHILRIQMEMNKLNLAYCFFPNALEWDNHLSSFRIILDLIPLVVPYLKNTSQSRTSLPFRFDIGILPALSLTGNFCRFKPERERVLQTFRDIGEYREGIWDATVIYHMAKWVHEIEEEWRDDNGFIPGERRIDFETADINIRRRTMTMRGWQGDGTPTGIILRTGAITW